MPVVPTLGGNALSSSTAATTSAGATGATLITMQSTISFTVSWPAGSPNVDSVTAFCDNGYGGPQFHSSTPVTGGATSVTVSVSGLAAATTYYCSATVTNGAGTCAKQTYAGAYGPTRTSPYLSVCDRVCCRSFLPFGLENGHHATNTAAYRRVCGAGQPELALLVRQNIIEDSHRSVTGLC